MALSLSSTNIASLQRRINTYKEVLQNTEVYRDLWKNGFKEQVIENLSSIIKECELTAKVEVLEQMENLEAIIFSLGETKSGMYQKVSDSIQRHLIKHNGSLIYQQLFNGKILVLVQYPYIEGYGKPRPPHTIAVYRPDEIKPAFITRHLETFFTEITNWEDFVNDEPQKRIGFDLNFGQAGNPQQ
ncbi:MAG: hypothetical protein EA409_12270 [Saprospirales bacterium]|nr:MAG: hypothetical protein EA409_12270 [Saprospirales bacterium]